MLPPLVDVLCREFHCNEKDHGLFSASEGLSAAATARFVRWSLR
jgi:hypothetical protein